MNIEGTIVIRMTLLHELGTLSPTHPIQYAISLSILNPVSNLLQDFFLFFSSLINGRRDVNQQTRNQTLRFDEQKEHNFLHHQ